MGREGISAGASTQTVSALTSKFVVVVETSQRFPSRTEPTTGRDVSAVTETWLKGVGQMVRL
jgi:hypothetical protein